MSFYSTPTSQQLTPRDDYAQQSCLSHKDYSHAIEVSNMRQRIRRVKQFSCELCGKCYVSKRGVEEHMKCKHMGYAFVCQAPGCTGTYQSRSSARRHRIEVHPNSDTVLQLRNGVEPVEPAEPVQNNTPLSSGFIDQPFGTAQEEQTYTGIPADYINPFIQEPMAGVTGPLVGPMLPYPVPPYQDGTFCPTNQQLMPDYGQPMMSMALPPQPFINPMQASTIGSDLFNVYHNGSNISFPDFDPNEAVRNTYNFLEMNAFSSDETPSYQFL